MTRPIAAILVPFLAATLLLLPSASVEARPQYLKSFVETYANVEDQAKAAKCAVCHPGTDKKVHNDYGTALAKSFAQKNEKDPALIEDAMKKTEATKTAEGTTFGQIIAGGKLPN